jgi:acetolactate decarboxylase
MKNYQYLLIAVFFLAFMSGGARAGDGQDVLFQVSTLAALDNGVEEGETTFGELKQHGSFGIGTFNGVDGEMVMLDGNAYQIRMDGVAYLADDSLKTPFAFVTFFEPDKTASLGKAENYGQLKQFLDKQIPTKNIFYAIKIEGLFKYIKVRTVPKQTRPFPPLAEIFKHEAVFELHDVRGTLVGFCCPGFLRFGEEPYEAINFPGYHFHFVTEDKKAGGHLYECDLEDAHIQIDYTPAFYLALPGGGDYFKLNELK